MPCAKLAGVIVAIPAPLLVKILSSPIVVPFAKVTASAVALLQVIYDVFADAAPLAVISVDENATLLIRTEPVPLASSLKLIFVSPPVALTITGLPVELFETVISFTADATVVNLINSLLFASLIVGAVIVGALIVGLVSVLFVRSASRR